ncbi:MAG: hypothetical protein ACD_45C00530G0001 [uncultured bacterium]|nr:MAG: hypothetical protein ACD_45C00530G0001 [uncultured bacterium]
MRHPINAFFYRARSRFNLTDLIGDINQILKRFLKSCAHCFIHAMPKFIHFLKMLDKIFDVFCHLFQHFKHHFHLIWATIANTSNQRLERIQKPARNACDTKQHSRWRWCQTTGNTDTQSNKAIANPTYFLRQLTIPEYITNHE